MAVIVWLMTQDSPRSRRGINDRSGWRRHAVEAPSLDAKYADLKYVRSACGMLPPHGWGDDFFIDDDQRCRRCERALKIEPSPFNKARDRVRAAMKASRQAS